MAENITLTELARRLGRSKPTVLGLVKSGVIPRNADGSFDEAAVRAAYLRNSDPSKTRKPLLGPGSHDNAPDAPATVRTIEDAQDAVSLIRRVLAEEGRGMDGAPSYDDVRTAETILKARERAQAIAVGERELIRKAPVMKHIEESFANFRKELQAMPARYGAQIAAEAGCDVGKLDAALSKIIKEQLDSLSAPLVRD